MYAQRLEVLDQYVIQKILYADKKYGKICTNIWSNSLWNQKKIMKYWKKIIFKKDYNFKKIYAWFKQSTFWKEFWFVHWWY